MNQQTIYSEAWTPGRAKVAPPTIHYAWQQIARSGAAGRPGNK